MADLRGAPAISKHIVKLARQIDPTGSPGYVTVESRPNCRPNHCFENVTAVVKQHGGSTQHGWNMREHAYFVEGEFYAVWRCPDGRLIDVTPSADGDQQSQILFLPDSKRVWEGDPVGSQRLLLRDTPCYCGTGLPFRICHGLDEG
jgi:hypothetical protein